MHPSSRRVPSAFYDNTKHFTLRKVSGVARRTTPGALTTSLDQTRCCICWAVSHLNWLHVLAERVCTKCYFSNLRPNWSRDHEQGCADISIQVQRFELVSVNQPGTSVLLLLPTSFKPIAHSYLSLRLKTYPGSREPRSLSYKKLCFVILNH